MYTGGCLCGGVQYRLEAEPGPIELCYCSRCRKASGSAFAANAAVPAAAFALTCGGGLLRSYTAAPGEQRVFCGRCGSPVYSRNEAAPEWLRLRMGAINEPVASRPRAHYYVASKCNWWDIRDKLPRHDED